LRKLELLVTSACDSCWKTVDGAWIGWLCRVRVARHSLGLASGTTVASHGRLVMARVGGVRCREEECYEKATDRWISRETLDSHPSSGTIVGFLLACL